MTGEPPTAAAMDDMKRLPGVTAVHVDEVTLTVDVAADAEVRVRDIASVLAEHSPQTSVDRDRLMISPHTIFEINAGVCFFCAEAPIDQTLGRRPFVQDWSVVDYRALGRMRFRIEPKTDFVLEELGGTDAFEDLILTSRYDGQGPPDLYWPTGGVEWRADEPTARREATASRKPLMIFPPLARERAASS